jgi:hypothetical protein
VPVEESFCLLFPATAPEARLKHVEQEHWTPHAGCGGKAKRVPAEHAITDLIAHRRKSQANVARGGL